MTCHRDEARAPQAVLRLARRGRGATPRTCWRRATTGPATGIWRRSVSHLADGCGSRSRASRRCRCCSGRCSGCCGSRSGQAKRLKYIARRDAERQADDAPDRAAARRGSDGGGREVEGGGGAVQGAHGADSSVAAVRRDEQGRGAAVATGALRAPPELFGPDSS